ncbi:Phosphoglycerate kinase [Candidatus Burarchaeum australiense]|nr:Phosphoglycerate kinase [Candidatus Burarchaeum australiense]
MDDFDFAGKVVLVRADLNSPVDEKTKKIEVSGRLVAHAATVKELAGKQAKVVVLAHQGRKGDYDFIPLEQHAKILSEKAGLTVKFVPDVAGEKAKAAVRAMKPGEVVLLDNVRFLDDETTGEPRNSTIVRELAPLADFFVLDALSVAHRAQASVVGFAGKLPVLAGRVMEQELNALRQMEKPEPPVVFILGGAKPEDSLPVIEYWVAQKKLLKALTCGVLGSLFLVASGRDVGKPTREFLESKGVMKDLERAKKLLKENPHIVEIPRDVAFERNGKREECPVASLPVDAQIKDIGLATSKRYLEFVRDAGTILMNGPAGVYEDERFEDGTRFLLRGVEHSKAFSLLGGGHTLSALDKFGIDKKSLGYVSLSGKALIEFLSGAKLPGIEMLAKGN